MGIENPEDEGGGGRDTMTAMTSMSHQLLTHAGARLQGSHVWAPGGMA